MKGIALVDRGLEEVCKNEIEGKIKTKCQTGDTIVIIPIEKEEQLCKLAYTCQSVRRILLLKKEIKIDKELENNKKEIEKSMACLKEYASKNVKVECERYGEHDFTSVDFAKDFSTELNKEKFKISRKENDVAIYIYIRDDKGFICIDYSGRDLSKRSYRIFTKAGSLKGTTAFALVSFAKYKLGELIIDPLCESGVIPIEAALLAMNKPVQFYNKTFEFKKINPEWEKVFEKEDKKIKTKIKNIYGYDKTLRNINSTKKNAKIAGVEKNINFSKTEIEWLDTKFEERTIDKIIIKLPAESKKLGEKIVEKIYQEFFYQAEYILKNNGLAVVCTLKNELLKKESKKKRFEIESEKKIYSGQQSYMVTVFKKVYKE